jgi:hypothetical protein
MRRQLVVVVHGVGVREAGASTDMVASALAAPPAEDRPGTPTSAELLARRLPDPPPMSPHSSDDFHLHEHPRYARGGIRRTFPARIRRYRHWEKPETPGQPPRATAERVLADFFWGDISATGADLPRLALGFVRIVLGLSHAIRESACEVFPADRPADARLRRLAAAAPLVLHGPILAINLVLLAGFVLHALLAWALDDCVPGQACIPSLPSAATVAALTGLVAAGLAALRLRRAASYLERHTWAWVVLTGLAVVLLALAAAMGRGPDTLAGMARAMVGAMLGFWALAYGCAAAAGLAAWWRRRRDPALPPALILPAFGLMTVLWFTTLSAVWALLLRGLEQAGLPGADGAATAVVHAALAGVLPALAALAALGLAGLVLHLGKARALAAIPPENYRAQLDRLDALAERWRLILAPALAVVLGLFLAGSAGFAALLLAGGADLVDSATSATAAALALVAGLAAGLFVWLRAPFAQGLAIVTDIVVWLNDHSWRTGPRADPPATLAAVPRSWPERLVGHDPAPPDPATAPRGYWPRQRIRDRLRVLMARLLADEDPDEIVLLSHSQGTVIALDVIAHEGAAWRTRPGRPDRRLTLVTMGSPLRHLYGQYFPRAWPSVRARPVLARVADGGLLDRWLNIYRIDDFVGTRLDPPGAPGPRWPQEYPVPPRGHTNYWLDPEVFTRLELELRLRGP